VGVQDLKIAEVLYLKARYNN